jgi:predicted transcriptional regulator
MDLTSEKAEIIKRFEQVNDASLIQAVKSLLDFALGKQPDKDEALEASIDKGLKQSEKGETRPHHEVMAEIRSRYKK